MSVYTKTGDRGKTSTFGGKRILKSSKLIETIGAIDELNSYLGVIGGLTDLQRDLFTINSILSGAKLFFDEKRIKYLERQIDAMESKMPVLANFLIYSGGLKSRKLYFARAICRRAERKLVDYMKTKSDFPSGLLIYLNRLSDYLFTLSRFKNFKSGYTEEIWNK